MILTPETEQKQQRMIPLDDGVQGYVLLQHHPKLGMCVSTEGAVPPVDLLFQLEIIKAKIVASFCQQEAQRMAAEQARRVQVARPNGSPFGG